MHILRHADRPLMSAELIADPERFNEEAAFVRVRLGGINGEIRDFRDGVALAEFGQVLVDLGTEIMPDDAPDLETVAEPERAPDHPAPQPEPIDATLGAVARAAEMGVDLSTVTGTGAGGRITVADVRAAASL